MFAVASLLVLVSAVAVSAVGPPRQDTCNTVYTGNPTLNARQLESVLLPPNIADWNVEIPPIPFCQATGVKAVVCDPDVAPSATFLNPSLLFIHRHGNLHHYGQVRVTVYCRDNSPAGTVLPQAQVHQAPESLTVHSY